MEKSNTMTKRGITTITASTQINLPKNKVWEVLQYPGEIAQFHPMIKSSKMLSEKSKGKGSVRHCQLLPMGVMIEKITEWEEGSTFTTEVTGGKMLPPYHFMKGKIEISDQLNSTLAKFIFYYHLKFGLFGRLMDEILVKPQFKKAPTKYLEGLKQFTENKLAKEHIAV